MLAVAVVMGLGIGIGALGLVSDSLYFIGAIIPFIGAIGLIVRLGDVLRRLRN